MKDARVDRWIALGLGVVYVVWLLTTAEAIGYARDEGFYFVAASDYRAWFRLLWQDPGSALELGAIDQYFQTNHEHPAGMKLGFAASHWLLHDVLGWLAPGTAYRFPSMALSGAAVAVLYAWGSRELGRAAGCVAAAGFALLPRVFFHAHLACFDVPVAALGLVTLYCYARSLSSRSWGWVVATGLAFAAQLDTKHNWVFVALAVLLHFALVSGRRASLPRAWLALFVLAPLLFFLGWPWLWAEPARRLAEYARFHLQHDYYNIEFLGVTRYAPPFPRAYAWMMTSATVPLSILVPFLFGLVIALRTFYDESRRAGWFRVELSRPESTWLLWCVALASNYAPWWSANTPIYGGTKHWLAAYPFLCLLAALGVCRVGRALSAPVATAASVLVAPFAITLSSHPHGLSSYTPLVGGAVGAAELGLNRGFWGYETGALAEDLSRVAPRGGSVFLHDTLGPSFRMLQADGRLRSDLRGSLDLPRTDVALYHHEPHMGRVEGQIWIAYGTTTPVAITTLDGVPIAWLYSRL